jgi:hypothetical protein
MMKWLSILKVLGPAVLMGVPGAQPFIPLIIAGIEVAEKSGKSGSEKKEIAKNAVKLGAEVANTVAKKEVLNSIEAEKVADNTIDAIVGIVNIVSAVKKNP